MGWWKIPDQFTLYRVYQEEIARAEKPLFLKASLIMTHIPYYPVPAYVADWSRFDDGTAYDVGLKSVAHDAYRDLMELSTWYVGGGRATSSTFWTDFSPSYVPENSLVIILGDHQPPKLATHDNDSWAVPMHVFSKRERPGARVRRARFRRRTRAAEEGLAPYGGLPRGLPRDIRRDR